MKIHIVLFYEDEWIKQIQVFKILQDYFQQIFILFYRGIR